MPMVVYMKSSVRSVSSMFCASLTRSRSLPIGGDLLTTAISVSLMELRNPAAGRVNMPWSTSTAAMSRAAVLPDQQDGALHVRREMQLLGRYDIAGQDVVHNNVFDEGNLIVLFFVVDLGAVDGNIGHQAQAPGGFVVAGDVNGIVKIGGVSRRQRFEGFFVEGDQRFRKSC